MVNYFNSQVVLRKRLEKVIRKINVPRYWFSPRTVQLDKEHPVFQLRQLVEMYDAHHPGTSVVFLHVRGAFHSTDQRYAVLFSRNAS